ncbi:MAG: hypothetical protein NUW22_10495 [Acidobacteria bacterium]|nr:hypothetical protein [Acidobacteriota bacterium]
MKTYSANQHVESGLYLNLKKFSITSLEADGPLPGTADDAYQRIPMLLMLAAAPLLGLVFVIFLPLIGFAMVAHLLGTRAVQFAQGVVGETDRVRRPGWVPALAYFSRSKRAERAKTTDAPKDAWTEEVEKKLEKTDRPA